MNSWIKKNIFYSLISSFLLACGTSEEKQSKYYLSALTYFKQDRYVEALEKIDSALFFDSANLQYRFTKAKILYELDEYQKSTDLLKILSGARFLRDTVNCMIADNYYSLGSDLYKQGKIDESNERYFKALVYYDSALYFNSNFYDAYLGKQRTLHNIDRYSEALVTLNKAIRLFPDSLTLICHRGVEKLALGDIDAAKHDLLKSVELNPKDSAMCAIAFRFLGEVSLEEELVLEAIDYFSKSIEFDDSDDFVFHSRGKCYEMIGNKEEACEDYRQAADLGYIDLYSKISSYCTSK